MIITGKGRKTRQVPICQESATALIDYMKGRDLRERIFQNARGLPLTRFGISHIIQTRTLKAATTCPSLAKKKVTPHTFRHTTAMHLLQSGVELTVIKSWLGHVQISTTHAYMEIDLKMKQKALGQCMSINNASKLDDLIRQNENVISWLDSL